MKYLRFIWKYKFVLPPVIALLALIYLVTYFMLTSWWTHQIFISKVNITWIKKAQASEMTVEQYACSKGWNCKIALAVAKAESGQRCDAQNVNTNKTLDLGYMQINSVHLKKGWKVTELLDCKKNIDYAYEIYEAQGFEPWSSYKNGSYKKFLN